MTDSTQLSTLRGKEIWFIETIFIEMNNPWYHRYHFVISLRERLCLGLYIVRLQEEV